MSHSHEIFVYHNLTLLLHVNFVHIYGSSELNLQIEFVLPNNLLCILKWYFGILCMRNTLIVSLLDMMI